MCGKCSQIGKARQGRRAGEGELEKMENPKNTVMVKVDCSELERTIDRLQEKVNRLNEALAEAKRTADSIRLD